MTQMESLREDNAFSLDATGAADAHASDHLMFAADAHTTAAEAALVHAAQSEALKASRGKRKRRRHVVFAAIIGDIAAVAGAVGLASFTVLDQTAEDIFLRVVAFIAPVFLLFAMNSGSYGFTTLSSRSQSIRAALVALALAMACFMLSAFFWKSGHTYSRMVLGSGAFLATMTLILNRLVIQAWARRYLGQSPLATACIYDRVPKSLRHGDCVLDAPSFGLKADASSPHAITRLGELTRKMDRVVIHCLPEDRENWAFMLKAIDVPSEIVVPELTALQPLAIEQRAGQVSLVISSGPLVWHQRLVKRTFDLVISVFALLLLAPIMLLVALIIRMESSGPALFKQDRIGLGNRKFKILKFRSMRTDMQDDKASKLTQRNDSRVTRVGAFIRKTSIDELPQLINVLKGDMSIVGPRPHAEMALAGHSLYWEVDETYWHRHVVKPGITGLAQVRGHRGNTFHEDHLRDRLQADLEYTANWSLLGDIRIAVQTFGVLFGKNAF